MKKFHPLGQKIDTFVTPKIDIGVNLYTIQRFKVYYKYNLRPVLS